MTEVILELPDVANDDAIPAVVLLKKAALGTTQTSIGRTTRVGCGARLKQEAWEPEPKEAWRAVGGGLAGAASDVAIRT